MRIFSLLALLLLVVVSCSKMSGTDMTPPATGTTSCATITVTTAVANTSPCANATGTITVSATGSTGFTYSLDSGLYQSANIFTNLAAGQYVLRARDQKGCIQTAIATISVASAGPLFTAAQTIVQTNCAVTGCHTGPTPQNGINFSDYCQILSLKARIKIRAVDWANTANQMPKPPRAALSADDQQKITDWINAGGGYGN